jgi:hypothetical protein
MEDFLSESQSGGCFLTLYAFVLQRLNTEHTAANDNTEEFLKLIPMFPNGHSPAARGHTQKDVTLMQ